MFFRVSQGVGVVSFWVYLFITHSPSSSWSKPVASDVKDSLYTKAIAPCWKALWGAKILIAAAMWNLTWNGHNCAADVESNSISTQSIQTIWLSAEVSTRWGQWCWQGGDSQCSCGWFFGITIWIFKWYVNIFCELGIFFCWAWGDIFCAFV